MVAQHMPHAFQMLQEVGLLGEDKNASMCCELNACVSFPEKIKIMSERICEIDVVFPVLHGTLGEDGCIQGLCRCLQVPFVGPGVLGASVSMDKDVTKRLLKEAGIACAKSLTFSRHEVDQISYNEIIALLGDVLFVKPANLGSSVGITKVKSADDFQEAVKSALSYDNKFLIEEYVKGREIECAVFGNEHPEVSLPGEITVKKDFYSYDAKYIDENGAELRVPADLPAEVVAKIRKISLDAFRLLCCEGMARVDFFVTEDWKVVLNEVNGIPGFTEASLYPRLWEASGIPFGKMLDKLISLAMDRHDRDGRLCRGIA
jgi:D-alanine-D-alanine ligase